MGLSITWISWMCKISNLSFTHSTYQCLHDQCLCCLRLILVTNCCKNTCGAAIVTSNRPHPIYFSFAGVSAGTLTAVTCRAISNCWHKHLSSEAVITNLAKPQLHARAAEQWRSRCLMLRLLHPYWAAAFLFPDWAISSALILNFHIAWGVP